MEAQSASRILLQQPIGSWAAHRILIGAVYVMAAYFLGLGLYDMLVEDIIIVYMFVAGSFVLILAEVLRRAHLRDIASGAIELGDGHLTIKSHEFLRSPLRIPLEDVRVAATSGTPLDARVDGPDVGRADEAFPVYAGANAPRGKSVVDHLGSDAHGLPVPSLAREGSPRNVLLLFRRQFPTPLLQRRPDYAPLARQPIGGLALTAQDPLHARSVFGAFGLRPRITEDDLGWYMKLEERRLRGDEIEGDEAPVSDVDPPNLVVLGWFALFASIYLPFLELWAMSLTRYIWKDGKRVQAVLLGALSFYQFTYHLWKLNQPEPVSVYYEYGAAVTATLFVAFGIVMLLRGRAARRLQDSPPSLPAVDGPASGLGD